MWHVFVKVCVRVCVCFVHSHASICVFKCSFMGLQLSFFFLAVFVRACVCDCVCDCLVRRRRLGVLTHTPTHTHACYRLTNAWLHAAAQTDISYCEFCLICVQPVKNNKKTFKNHIYQLSTTIKIQQLLI